MEHCYDAKCSFRCQTHVCYLAVCHVILIGMLCGLGHKVHHRFVLCIYSSRIFTLHTTATNRVTRMVGSPVFPPFGLLKVRQI